MKLLACADGCTDTKSNKETQQNTLFTEDLPYHGAPYSPLTCLTTEHSTQRGLAPLQNTGIICGPVLRQNFLLTKDLPNGGTPYSPWTCITVEHRTHLGPALTRKTLLTVDMPHQGTLYSYWTYLMLNTLLTQ